MARTCLPIFLCASLLYLAASYPTGAPEQACGNFRPFHLHRTTKQPYEAKNENQDDAECPYRITYSRKFVPGQPLILNISVKDSADYFRGFMLSVVEIQDDSRIQPLGRFRSSAKTICGGKTVTQSSGERRAHQTIEWIAPANASKKKFAIRATIVKSFSSFWVQCSPTEIPAFDADIDEDTNETSAEIFQKKNGFELPVENIDKPDSAQDKDDKSQDKKQDDQDNSKDNDKKDVTSEDSDISTSSEDINSVGKDESGNSNENSIDVSDNRSGSSLNSEEKESRRTKFLNKGIKSFDGDIKKFLKSVGKESLYDKLKTSDATSAAGLTTLVAMALAMLTVM